MPRPVSYTHLDVYKRQEFIIVLDKAFNEKTEHAFKEYLSSIGDSIVCVADEEIVKIHVHTNDPGLAIQRALTYGSLSKIKIDNMREEHQEKLIKDAQKMAKQQAEEEAAKAAAGAPRKEVGFIAVSMGEGLNEIFKGLGVDYIIEGGQTMNPSTEDFLQAIDQVNACLLYTSNCYIALQEEEAALKVSPILIFLTLLYVSSAFKAASSSCRAM